MMHNDFRFNLGDKARDRISGLVGIVTSRSEHLFGCNRYWLEPQELKDSKPVDGRWFDEDALDLVQAEAIAPRRYRVVEADEAAKSAHMPRKSGGPSAQPAVATGPTNR